MRTTDNNCGIAIKDFVKSESSFKDLFSIANKSLIDLQKDNPDLLIFQNPYGDKYDDVEKTPIFELNETTLTTFNLMGFVGRNSTQLTITSRFAKDDQNDYFLHYMLQKVFSINLINFDQTQNNEKLWDFLLYLFPFFLKKAYSQGLYKAYKKVEYNDANVKGTIDVKRHILKNIPFTGNIAYTSREHSYDNNLNQLIRHTIEYIKTHLFGSGVLTYDSEVLEIISKFNFVTQKSYNKNSLQKIITANLNPVSHPYFTEYTLLQKICLKILRQEKITFGKEKDKVYGLLFDGAWLWEEYLNTILIDCDFEHPQNKKSIGAINLFSDRKNFKCYPDFWKKNFILDAKYKDMSNGINREDLYQIISYMHIMKAELGGLLYPSKDNLEVKCKNIGNLKGYGGNIKTWSLPIPQISENFKEFTAKMNQSEQELKMNLKSNF